MRGASFFRTLATTLTRHTAHRAYLYGYDYDEDTLHAPTLWAWYLPCGKCKLVSDGRRTHENVLRVNARQRRIIGFPKASFRLSSIPHFLSPCKQGSILFARSLFFAYRYIDTLHAFAVLTWSV